MGAKDTRRARKKSPEPRFLWDQWLAFSDGKGYERMVSYGAEFLCAAAWGVALLPYLIPGISRYAAQGLGMTIWVVLSWLILYLGFPDHPPRLTPCVVLIEMFYDTPGRARRVPRESFGSLVARLALQWLGAFVGCAGFFGRLDADRHPAIYEAWKNIADGYELLWVGAFQTLVLALITLFWMRHAYDVRAMQRVGPFWMAMRYGAWMGIFVLPWGGISCSLVSFLWVQNVFMLVSSLIPAVLAVSTVAGAFLGGMLWEMSSGSGAAVRPQKPLAKPT